MQQRGISPHYHNPVHPFLHAKSLCALVGRTLLVLAAAWPTISGGRFAEYSVYVCVCVGGKRVVAATDAKMCQETMRRVGKNRRTDQGTAASI